LIKAKQELVKQEYQENLKEILEQRMTELIDQLKKANNKLSTIVHCYILFCSVIKSPEPITGIL
jgi:predicted negative regulator of RcsB-dependent stress response